MKLILKNINIGYIKTLIEIENICLETGKITLLLGKNGSGKTTLLKSILGMNPFLKGTVLIDDKHLIKQEAYKYISVVLSKNNFNQELDVFELLCLGRFPYKKWYDNINKREKNNILDIINFIGLEKYKHFKIKHLSDGNIQKVAIARAIVQDSKFIILDEPTTFLDLENKLLILELLKKLAENFNKGILFTSHDLEYSLNISDFIWLIKDQKIISDYSEDLAFNQDIFKELSNHNFNYKEHIFDLKSENNRIKVDLITEDFKLNYWFKQALFKSNFILDKSSAIKIYYINNTFILKKSNQINEFKSIKEVIYFLKENYV